VLIIIPYPWDKLSYHETLLYPDPYPPKPPPLPGVGVLCGRDEGTVFCTLGLPLTITIHHPLVQIRKANIAQRCGPPIENCSTVARNNKTPITRTPNGLASYAMSPRKDINEMEDISVQKVGMREDSEKKTYE